MTDGGETSRGLILMYHRVAEVSSDPWGLCVTPAHFAEHLAVLRARTSLLKASEFAAQWAAGATTATSVAVTFDDGYADNLYHAKPLLELYEVSATCFVSTGSLGQRAYWWDELEQRLLHPGRLPHALRLETASYRGQWDLNGAAWYGEEEVRRHRSWKAWEEAPTLRHQIYTTLHSVCRPMAEPDRRSILNQLCAAVPEAADIPSTWRPLTEDEVVTLGADGLVEIGAHTITHPVLSACPSDVAQREIAGSRRALEEILGRPVTSFAFPYGGPADYSQDTVKIVQEAGFSCAYSTTPGVVGPGAERFQLPRVQVEDWTGEEFSKRLAEWLKD